MDCDFQRAQWNDSKIKEIEEYRIMNVQIIRIKIQVRSALRVWGFLQRLK